MKKLRRKPKRGERLSFDAIADRLNATGVPTRTGARWRGPTVHGILKRAGRGAVRRTRFLPDEVTDALH